MTSTNFPSEALWQLLHETKACLTEDGFAGILPPRPQGAGQAAGWNSGSGDLAARYGDFLEFGAVWPAAVGSPAPLAVILTAAPLSDSALSFVRTWFENPRVNLTLADHFLVHPMPRFASDTPPYQDFVRDLCGPLAPKALLSLGPDPAQRLLGAPLSLDTLRGSDFRFDRWSIITTLDPEDFLSLEDDERNRFKGQVWKDLQRLLGKLKYA